MTAPAIARSVTALRAQVRAWRADGLRVGFVPTMGALHEGHLSLVRLALAQTDQVVVSIFVNPTQFAPGEDLDRYPRDEAGDLAKLAAEGTHLVFLPTVAEMYPEGASTWVEVEGLSEGLCADRRPHHFRGVATVVTKLLNQAQADVAVFGEKDYQQLMVIKRLARDLAIPTRIEGGTTVRELDGLAMSSRNVHLKPEHRRTAAVLNRTLQDTAAALADGRAAAPLLEQAVQRLVNGGFDSVDYVQLRHAESLAPLAAADGRPARLLAAAHLGSVRLIDNIPVPPL
ncbi:MAG: pantoate--beta-alanine ligase [Geminicoccaceae bacterium]